MTSNWDFNRAIIVISSCLIFGSNLSPTSAPSWMNTMTTQRGQRWQSDNVDDPMDTSTLANTSSTLGVENTNKFESSSRSLLNNRTQRLIIILHPLHSQSAIDVELVYNESLFPYGFNVSLMADPNERAVNCNDPRFLKRIWDSCKSIKLMNHRVKCNDLQPGLYCARAHQNLPNGDHGRTYASRTIRLDDVTKTNAVTLPVSRKFNDGGLDADKVVSICVGIGCSFILLVLLLLLILRKRSKRRHLPVNPYKGNEEKKDLIDVVRDKSPVRVYLMYYPECYHHVEFVEFLANFLTNNNCQVSYDLKEMNSIAVNAASWIHRKLSGRYKILIVNSKGGFEQQTLWLDNQGVIIEDTVSSDTNMFLSALAIIMHQAKQAFDYCTVYMLRPSYVSKHHLLRNICPGKQYEIPTDLNHLICHLHDLDPQRVRLDGYPSDIWKHCASSYDALMKQAHQIAGLDMITEDIRLAGVCNECNAALVTTTDESMISSSPQPENGISERLLNT